MVNIHNFGVNGVSKLFLPIQNTKVDGKYTSILVLWCVKVVIFHLKYILDDNKIYINFCTMGCQNYYWPSEINAHLMLEYAYMLVT